MKKRTVMEHSQRMTEMEMEIAEICSQVIVSMDVLLVTVSSLKMERSVRFAISRSLWVSGWVEKSMLDLMRLR